MAQGGRNDLSKVTGRVCGAESASRGMRGEGEAVRGLLMGKEGWKRTCPPGIPAPFQGAACTSVAVQSIAQHQFSTSQQYQLPHRLDICTVGKKEGGVRFKNSPLLISVSVTRGA